MSGQQFTKYDDMLVTILENEKSILGFLTSIFNFLARRTDFYYVPEGPYQNMGFPPGVAEELVIKVLRSCDPKNWKPPNEASKLSDVNNEILCSTVAQEVEVIADDKGINDETSVRDNATLLENDSLSVSSTASAKLKPTEMPTKPNILNKDIPKPSIADDYEPPVIPTQKNSESYNGAVREKYTWSQTIMELDAIVILPSHIKSSKQLKVTINANEISVVDVNGDIIIKDSLPFKIKTTDSFWSISEGRLLIHLDKVQERWWTKFLNSEEDIDLSKIDCSRPLDELPEDHIAKVREMQWNQERKMQGLPTSDEIRNIEILKRAWNADGSPFKGKEFDPNILKH